MSRGFASLLVVLAIASVSDRAEAQNAQTTAEALFVDARKLMSEKRFAEACPKLEESLHLDPALGTMMNLAACYERNGQSASAWAEYRAAAAIASSRPNDHDRERIARERADLLEPTLPKIVVVVPEASIATELKVLRDGVPVAKPTWGTALPVDPGPHTIAVSAPGKRAWSKTVSVVAGATATIEVPALAEDDALPAATNASPPPPLTATMVVKDQSDGHVQRTAGAVMGGAGVVGVGLGFLFWGIGSGRYKQGTSAGCKTVGDFDYCPADGLADRNAARGWGNASTAAMISGLVLAAGGAIVFFAAPSKRSAIAKLSALRGEF